MQGFTFIGANQPIEHPHMEIEVRFASDRSYDYDDDDVPGGTATRLRRLCSTQTTTPDFGSDWEAEYGLSGDDDGF